MIEIKIQVPNEEWADVFWGWYLDGGGDDGFMTSLEDDGLIEAGETFSDDNRKTRTIRHSDKHLP